jgi:hypothetical protein
MIAKKNLQPKDTLPQEMQDNKLIIESSIATCPVVESGQNPGQGVKRDAACPCRRELEAAPICFLGAGAL